MIHLFPSVLLSGLPSWLGGKESVHTGDPGSNPGSGRSPGEGTSNPFQYSCLENPKDKRSLEGYSPWGRTESEMTEVT